MFFSQKFLSMKFGLAKKDFFCIDNKHSVYREILFLNFFLVLNDRKMFFTGKQKVVDVLSRFGDETQTEPIQTINSSVVIQTTKRPMVIQTTKSPIAVSTTKHPVIHTTKPNAVTPLPHKAVRNGKLIFMKSNHWLTLSSLFKSQIFILFMFSLWVI